MILEFEIRDKLVDLVTGEITVDAFDHWLSAASWNMHKDSSVDARLLVGSIELVLAEHSEGHLSDEELRRRLVAIASQVVASVFVIVEPVLPSFAQHRTAQWFQPQGRPLFHVQA